MKFEMDVQEKNGWSYVYFKGPFDEGAGIHFVRLYDLVGKKARFNFKEVPNINSSGVRAWMLFIRDFKDGREVIFEECPPEVVSQINMIPSFSTGCTIESIYAPYLCDSCGAKRLVLYTLPGDLPKIESGRTPSCEKCSEETQLEDDMYFAFIEDLDD